MMDIIGILFEMRKTFIKDSIAKMVLLSIFCFYLINTQISIKKKHHKWRSKTIGFVLDFEFVDK